MRYRFVLFLIVVMTVSVSASSVAASRQPSEVTIKGKELIVSKRLPDGTLALPRSYLIRGLTWTPASRAPETGPGCLYPSAVEQYGFFFDWPGRDPKGYEVMAHWMRSETQRHYQGDSALMKEMNVNTIRLYTHFGLNRAIFTKILDEFYRNGIMVIVTVAASKKDIDSKQYLRVVKAYRFHPAILMWALGNEWNLEYNKYWGYKTVEEAAYATEAAAARIKRIDHHHPVLSILGDRFKDKEVTNTVGWIVKNVPSVDVWGLNVYRGASFGTLFEEWQAVTEKPFYLSEFGTDSFRTTSYTLVNGFQADNCQGVQDQQMQADYALGLWEEIFRHLVLIDERQACLGGMLHEFCDELWKVGCYHASLGGLVNYYDSQEAHSYQQYNTEGFVLPGGHPDDVANEEFFGVVDADRQPKKLFWELQEYYGKLADVEARLYQYQQEGCDYEPNYGVH